MTLKISNELTVAALQQAFSERFPFLKLVFFRKPHQKEQRSWNKDRYPDNTHLGAIIDEHICDEINIKPGDRTADVEREFEQRFGLHVQVYRKAGIEWVQTVGTDNLTMAEQNSLGERSSTHIIHPAYNERIEDREY